MVRFKCVGYSHTDFSFETQPLAYHNVFIPVIIPDGSKSFAVSVSEFKQT